MANLENIQYQLQNRPEISQTPQRIWHNQKLSDKKRTNPFAVYPPTKEFRENGTPVPVPALAYVNSWIKGFGILTACYNGTYAPGQELPEYLDCSKQADLIQGIVSEYNTAKRARTLETREKTFSEIYQDFFRWKFQKDKSKTYSENTINCTKCTNTPLCTKSLIQIILSI